MTPERARLLAWTLGAPFFLLPVSLTIDAPDIFGGYGVHLRAALLLAALGMALGLGERAWERTRERTRERTTGSERASEGAALRWLPWVLGMAALAVPLALAAGWSGSQTARSLGWTTMRLPSGPPPVPLQPLLALGFAAVGLRALGRRGEGSLGRVLAPLALLFLATVIEGQAGWLALGAVGVGMVWPQGPSRTLDRLSAGLVLGAVLAFAGAMGLWTTIALARFYGEVVVRAMTLGLATAAMVAAVRGGWTALNAPRGVQRLRTWLHAVSPRVPLLLALLLFGRAAMTVAGVVAGAGIEWLSLLNPSSQARWLDPSPSAPLLLVWTAWLLRFGLRARTRGDALRLAGAASTGWALLVASRVAMVLSEGPARLTWEWVGVWVLLGALLLSLRWRPRLHPRWALLPGLLWLGPLAVRYALALLGTEPATGLVAALGMGLAFVVAFLVRGGAAEEPVALRSLAIGLPLLGVGLLLPIYITVYAGLDPAGFLLGAGLLGLGAAASRHPSLPTVPAPIALWLLFYVSFVQTAAFKAGPNAEECGAVLARTTARVLIDRHGEGYGAVFPYDAIPLPGGAEVLASFKRIDKNGGFVETVQTADPRQRVRTPVRRDGPLWPERLVTDASTGHAWVQVIGVGAHGMWELVPDGHQGVRVGRSIPLRHEPGNPALDAERRRIAITYVPNREGGNPVVEVFDLDTLASVGATDGTQRMMQMADFVETDRSTGRHYAPLLFDFLRFGILEVGGTLQRRADPGDTRLALPLGRYLETFHPVIGLAADPEQRRLYLTNPLAGTLSVLDLDRWELIQTLPAGRFPRDVAQDLGRHRLYVANYGDGSVITYSTDGGRLQELARAEVGGLLRGVGVDPQSGRAVAASGCGVFELR